MRKTLCILFLLVSSLAFAQTEIDVANTGSPTNITPYYFGPNAFPVPEILDGTETAIRGELWGDYFRGHLTSDPDQTADFAFKLVVPFWTGRINLSVWGQFREWYWDTVSAREIRRVNPSYSLKGNAMGDAYISTDILCLREGLKYPGITLRVGLKTASGDSYPQARYYDSAGYFFDLCLFKNIMWDETAFFPGMKVSAGGGFLCWQTDNGRQNDAFLFATAVTMYSRVADLKMQVGGYRGWEKNHDFPVAFKASLTGHAWRYVNPIIRCQIGINDYPFYQIGGGISITVDQWRKWVTEKE